MNVFESRTLMAWLSCLLAVQAAQAQPPATGPEVFDPTVNAPLISDAPGSAVAGNYFGYTEVDRTFEPLLRVDTRGGRLMGQDGFTRISAFMPYWLEDDALLYADAGAMILYNPSGGASLNAGWRYFVDDLDRVFGLHAGYDYDPGHNREYNQFTIGFESLGRYVDYRATGYIPFGSKTNVLSSDLSGPVSFNQNNIILGRVRGIESAMTGFDVEIGGPVPILGRYGVSTYLGGYFFDGSNTGNVTGFSSRTQGQVNEDLTVGVQVSHDSVFQTDVQMQVTWTIPDGLPGRWMRQPTVRSRLTAPVVRNQRVIARNDNVITPEIALNPADGLPFFVSHINPNRTPGTGTGTFEDPFSQLSQFNNLPLFPKSNVDIIYVTARNDGTSTQLNTGVTLLNNQRLLSTAVAHTFTAIQGTFTLPGNIGGPLPVLSRTGGGDVVTLAAFNNNIEVSGFTINGSATGNGIAGFANQRANINRNVIQNGQNGVRLTNLTGVGAASRSLIDSNTFQNNLGDGFSVINILSAPLEIFVTNNTAIGNLGNGFRLQANLGSSIGGRITGNSTDNGGVAPITGSAVIGTSNVNNGLRLVANGGDIDFFNLANDWRIGGLGATDSNNFSDNGNFGINVVATAFGDTSLRIIDNDVSRNSLNGIGVIADSGTHILTIGGTTVERGNRFVSNGLNGNLIDLYNVATMDLSIQNNTYTRNGAGGAGGGAPAVPVSLYDLDVVFGGGLTASQQAIFAIAAAKWESIITGDVPDQGAIDDLRISAEGLAIDGAGGILGQAGPTAFRAGTFLPFDGIMQFDSADLAALEAAGQLDEVILHEMGHVMGIGTIWQQLGLLTGAGTADPQFTGTNAVAEYNTRFGLTATSVPVEGSAGPGTNDAHWRETTFDNELMTGFLNAGVANPISRMTVGQLQDLGYVVNYAAADPYVQAGGAGPRIAIGQVIADPDMVNPIAPAAPVGLSSLTAPGAAIGDGINISVAGNATLTTSTILDNTITQSARHGLFVTTNNTADVPNLQVRRNIITDNGTGTVGSGIFLDRFASSTLNMTAEGNTLEDNLGDGLTVNSQNLAAGGGVTINSFDNTYSSNNGNGANLQAADAASLAFTSNRDTLSDNTLNGLNALSEDTSNVTLRLRNVTANDNTLDGMNLLASDQSVMDALINSPVDPLFTGVRSEISSNNVNGVQASAANRARLILAMDEVDALANLGDGVNLSRVDTSLVQATLTDVSANGNSGDGLEFFFAGARHTDPLQPLSGTPTSLNVTDSSFNSNVGNGMRIEGRADGVLLANLVTSAFNNNTTGDGIQVSTFETASFGISPANRSIFNGITATGNGDNGIELNSSPAAPFASFIFLNVNADAGNTLISANTGNGVEINASGNTTDVILQGDTVAAAPNFTTQITNNAGDGVEININTDANVLIRDVTIANNGADGVDVNNNGIGGVITIGSAGDTTIIQNNAGDGVSFTQTDLSTPDRITGNITNTQILDNRGHGVSLISDGVLSENFADSRYFFTMRDSEVRRSGLNGVNIVLNGHMLGNQFEFDNNTLANNGSQGTDGFTSNGFFFQQNAQDTLKPFDPNNTTIPGSLYRRVLTGPAPGPFPINPNNPGLLADPNYDSPYLNLTTALQSELVFTRNVVNFNGNNAIGTGEGVYLRLSTNTYLAADVGGANGSGLGNTFSGNTLADFRTASFLATARGDGSPSGLAAGTVLQPPPNGTDNADPNPDVLFLDDTAQLDLRFKNNVGTDLNPSLLTSDTAIYRNADPAKGVNNTFRVVQYFQVDGPAAQIDASNVFTLPGFPGFTETDFFINGGYNIRSVAAPIFPNPGFPPFGP